MKPWLMKRSKESTISSNMVTPFREAKSPDIGYYNLHVLSTQLLAKAALKQPDFKRFIHVSTIGVHGHVENPPGDENGNELHIYSNPDPNPHLNHPRLWTQDHYRRSKMTWNYYSP